MERKQNGGSMCSGAVKRMLSLVLALVMLLSLVPATGLFTTEVSAATTQTIYFKNSNGWGSVYGYAWDSNQNALLGGWPGTKLSQDSSGYYKMSVSASGSLNFIFNNGSGGDGNQTADLSLTAAQVSAGKTYLVDGVAGSPVAYTPPVINGSKVTFTYEGSASKVLLAGSFNGWSGVSMTKNGTTFTYTYDLEPGMHEYKFVVDGNWISDPSNPNVTGTDGNSYIVISGSGSTATGNTVKIHFQNALDWGTVCGSAWTTVGTVSTVIDGWSWPGQALQIAEDGTYVMELQPSLTAGQSLGYLFHDFNSQQTVDLFIDYNTLSKGNVELWVKPTTANDEGKFNCSTATSFTASPKVDGNKVTFTYTGSATSVSVAGSFNSWTATKMTKSGSTFTYTTNLTDGIYEYKFVVNGTDWIKDPANSRSGGSGDNSILIVGDHTANTADDKITVQFHVTKTGSYTGWDAWVWSDYVDGSSYALKTGTLSSKLVSVTVDGSSSYVAFILRKSDWSSQDETYYVDLKNVSSGTVHCFVDYASDSITTILDKDVKRCGSLSYAQMDYQSNTFWVKTTAPVDMSNVQLIKANGSAADVTVTGVSAEGFGYNLSLSRAVTLDDLPDLRIYLNGSDCKIEPNGAIFHSQRFHDDYYYGGNDLGATWTRNGTTFKVWAPTAWDVKVVRYSGGRWDSPWIETVDMTRGANGTWSVTIPGDLNGTYYTYQVGFANGIKEATDPYAKSSGSNGDRSMVLDMTSTNPAGWDNDISPNQGMTYTDAIIYEMHVREFTIDSTSGVKDEWKGKYLGLTQTGTSYQGRATGLDHLKELGITHVQLMPVNDIADPSENDLGQGRDYSWGYNPKQFNVPEGSYSTDPQNGAVRVNEFKQMVQTLHSNGINVVMDVVYNHLADAESFSFNRLVPLYFTRMGVNGQWGTHYNDSYVGNDVASQRAMVRKYIVDSLLMWVEEYHVDGFRFDLAGLIDTQTMNEAINIIHAKYPNVMFYGEGWERTYTLQDGYTPCNMMNAWQVPGFAFYNDTLRDALGGGESENNGEWGFAMGASEKVDIVKYSMRGQNYWCNNPTQIMNYSGCHDGYSLTDKICVKRGGAPWNEIATWNRLATAGVLLAQGIPLLYSGDELLRMKLMPDGTRAHNSGEVDPLIRDSVNSIKWSNLLDADSQITDDYYSGLVNFRKNHAALRCTDGNLINECMQVYDAGDRTLMYYIGKVNGECSDGIVIILNGSDSYQTVNFYNRGVPYGNWQACVHGNKAGVNALWSTTDGTVGVEPYSATVLVLGDLIDENSVYNRQSSNSGCRHTTHTQDGKCVSCGTTVAHSYTAGTCSICGKIQPGSDTVNTIYVDITGSGWNKVNVYAWDDTASAVTGQWPGSLMTKVEGNIYSYKVSGAASYLIFNNGSSQTDDLVIPTDGKNLYSLSSKTWSVYGQGGSTTCSHNYTSKVTTAATCEKTGVKTYTCSKCSNTYTETIAALGHNYANGSCTTCGAKDPNYVVPGSTVYYLIGYINGANYGCEEDYENMGSYKFVDGKLSVKFDSDSYIFLKTEGNGKWLLTESYCTDSTATFIDGGTEKMFVPGGKALTFTLTENADGSVTLSYTEDGSSEPEIPEVTPSIIPTLTLKAPTLEFKDMITVNAMFTAENLDDVVEMGMITYTTKVSSWSVETAAHVIPGTTYDASTGRYIACSQGIHAKYLGDTVYLATYAKLTDGTYAYSKLAGYSPVQYATSKLSGTDTALKQLVVAMLNYGAAAQTHFGHNTSALANASLTAEQKALPAAYNSGMVSTVASVPTAKQGSFAGNTGFSKRYPSISFEGAFCINYFFTPSKAPDNGITLYYWNAEDYNAASVLTTANATGSIKMSGSGTGEYQGDITGIAAKALSEAVYVSAVYQSGGTTYTSGVLGYSIGAYCASQSTKGGTIADLAMATAVYGYHAKAFFG